ncbi:DUF6114 domain-containing protein [Streptomyces sp. 71268]|uniref:DUF6114 domain-containing protein n=1 Tax=Streptomyces sp. 71268 TaxID=3002640 RepID=UPI0023F88921|nr:DUF6114 domain-containing protein [Streptomyces sp. 71268]WEV23861.1 DUF6114 domain-containing protein [Streptomyces sp. 71268]
MLLTFRRWRRGRPFWGGLITVAAGAEIAAIPLAPMKVMVLQGVTGVVSVMMGLVLVVMGLSAWFAPYYRGLAGVLAVLVAAGALVLSNLGGFFVGTIVGVVGGSLIFAWQPLPPATRSDPPAEPDATPDGDPGAEPDGSASPRTYDAPVSRDANTTPPRVAGRLAEAGGTAGAQGPAADPSTP